MNRSHTCCLLFYLTTCTQGLYAAPLNVPAGFTGLSRTEKYAALNTEPVKSMFRGGGTRNARLLGMTYPYNVASLPGMYNEGEQSAITNKRVLLHSYHAALSMFIGHGWTTKTLFDKVATGQLDQELCSFMGYMLCAQDTLPSTQEYVSDYWIVPNPQHPQDQRGTAQWFAYPGEDWQVANASMASWNPEQKWSPSGHDDCESKFHHILSKHLSFVELAGGKGSGIIQGSVYEKAQEKAGKIAKYVKKKLREKKLTPAQRKRLMGDLKDEQIKEQLLREKQESVKKAIADVLKQLGRVPAAASDISEGFGAKSDAEPVNEKGPGMRKVVENVRRHVFHSETKFEDNVPVQVCNSLISFAQFCKDYQPGKSEDAQTVDLVHGIALVCGLQAADFYSLEGVLGTAFGGSVGSTVKKEGGHMYGLQRLGKFSAILEGTASVENRMNFEHAHHTKSIMKFEKGLCTMMESIWLTEAFDRGSTPEELPIPKLKPMMTCSNLEHTEVSGATVNVYVITVGAPPERWFLPSHRTSTVRRASPHTDRRLYRHRQGKGRMGHTYSPRTSLAAGSCISGSTPSLQHLPTVCLRRW